MMYMSLYHAATCVMVQKSKYIGHLQSVARVRGIESDRRYERKLLREREQEDEEFGDKQKFVTSAYRKKLEEEEKWAYEDRLADKVRRGEGGGGESAGCVDIGDKQLWQGWQGFQY
jgi:hypothetical protein